MKPGISAIIVVHDQLDLLKKCLESIHSWVDEIIIIDLESTKDIKALVRTYEAKYYAHKLVPIVEAIRQESLKYATHEYVLFLDPDEYIPASLAKDLVPRVKERTYDYFITPRQNYVFGKWLRHSRWWPDAQTRIFRQGHVTWGPNLHAEAKPIGHSYTYPTAEEFAIHHDNYRNLDEYFIKNMRYAKADANERLASNNPLTFTTAIQLSLSELMSRFFRDQGYLDGMHGLILSLLQSYYYFLVYAYYWEAKKYTELESESDIKSFPRAWFSHGLSEVLYWDQTTSFAKSIKEKLVRKMIG